MPDPFLSSEEYDERAHTQYDHGEYDAALETLKEGLRLYPHSVELYVGLGYTRLAREEFAWARHAFEKALVLDPEHDDGLVGLGETLLRFGRYDSAMLLFRTVRNGPSGEDPELLLSMGRALYREQRFHDARDFFEAALQVNPGDAEATAALGFSLHRLNRETEAVRALRNAISLDPRHLEARVYLAHLLYDREDWKGALEGFAALSPADHWDPLAVWRLIELKRTIGGLGPNDPELLVWENRLDELEAEPDAIEELLAEVEAGESGRTFLATGVSWSTPPAVQPDDLWHRVRLPDGTALEGSWVEIVRQLRDRVGRAGESIAQFMRRWAEDARVRIGVGVPTDDAEGFLLAHARAGLLHIER
ncbi:MAG TPA: tetratricopeptide repeat protein [Longimicrobiales bacterium]|nr:tetratricopeptide repeat protein [Longimicrobiales bacterium]